MYIRITAETLLIVFGTLLSILLRACTNLHSYSGEASPPMYGDYEAQRHWMEITTNLPINQWYHNTSDNDLNYWGLDYPPLSAYHMFICGKIAQYLNDNYTKLHDSRGYESESHKLFMRYTVMVCDIFLYIPALIIYYQTCIGVKEIHESGAKKKKWKNQNNIKMSSSFCTILGLLYPGIIIVDHGHFQYNCVSLGFAIFSITFLLKKYDVLASILFCFALNYKQMELYHSLPFFLYLLSSCVPKPGQKSVWGFLKLFKISAVVIITFCVIWLPFLYDFDDFIQVVHRQFPFARGVFEDKVSNVWCALNVIFKFKKTFDDYQMMRICLFTTFYALLPSSVDLFLRPNLKKFILSQINSSLAFFLFSFQVHEKSILLVAVPVLLYFPYDPFTCFWFLCLSVFSMTPLLLKDGLTVAFMALMLFYGVTFRVSIEHCYRNYLNNQDGLKEYYRSLLHSLLNIEYKKATQIGIIKASLQQIRKNSDALKILIFHCVMVFSLIGCLILFIISLLLEPPTKYPDLFPLAISVYSCIHFLGFFLYFNIKQLKIPQQFEDIRVKES
ncbi:dolichyl pyrophosphate Man9GlcNAc2 alpha-1,3-glucosyltransferase [Diorhabda sublineata]|uniref:dolichyl pyrophosphate Man9GlcNAc2 alpha-1,3-glucosyltransferase n=1 Tax=Diorhabda sublineata TaxID=1163346 RepID=UPI0024E097A4|nr:dolichyl pyrophosphate Man9GlcNAc2 alpha-1,3-glucosyltransferase [Diorhabda sublineata]